MLTNRRRVLLRLLLVILASGCALKGRYSGIVEVDGRRVDLWTLQDDHYRLFIGEQQQEFLGLDGCRLEIDASRLGRWLLPRSWRVTDAGDGSVPYLGLLRAHGSNLVLDDRYSGMPIIIHRDAAEELSAYVGEVVLLIGYVVGTQEVQVVAYRVLP